MESLDTLVHTRPGPDPRSPRPDPIRPHPPEETLLLGRYRLLERLGSGGFGVVWRAYDELLHREVALKRVSLGAGGDPIDSERATREALAAARLAHPAIVALYEACAAQDAFYLISELVHGETLAELIAARALADEEVLEIGIALAGALAHAHARGVIHRDVKPRNVLIPHDCSERGGAAKLTDFGGARLTGEDALTRTGDVLGTLAYMAPEQSEGREAAEPADLYSLALVLYEAFSGVNPVRGLTPAATARRIGQAVTPLECARGDLPRPLTRAIDLALAPAPERRGTLGDLNLTLEATLERGLRRSRRGPGRHGSESPQLEPRRAWAADTRAPESHEPTLDRRPYGRKHRRDRLDPERGLAERDLDHGRMQEPSPASTRRLELPRAVWLGCALAAIVWQVWVGRPGVALLLLAGAAPLVMLGRRSGLGWLTATLAPVLGLVGLAGAFPALAGQRMRLSDRAALAALGYWWLTLAEPLLERRLWVGPHTGTPARGVWEGSLSSTAVHVIAPALSLGVLLGASLWALAAGLLPWIVRGRSAVLDLAAASAWSAVLVLVVSSRHYGSVVHSASTGPRGAILGGLLGGALAVAARALRGRV